MKFFVAFTVVMAGLLTSCSSTALVSGVAVTKTPVPQAATATAVAGVASVRITRNPGTFILLPPIDRTITDPATVTRLENDIDHLPAFPTGGMSCTIDFFTTYTLVFSNGTTPVLTAVVSALGCRVVTLSTGRTLSAARAPWLYTDLGATLGLTMDELQPFPCPALNRTVCYHQLP